MPENLTCQILRSHLAWRMGTAAATALLARVKDAIDA